MSDDESIADEPFVRWCDEFELHPSTIMELAKEGFTTMLSVQTLTYQNKEQRRCHIYSYMAYRHMVNAIKIHKKPATIISWAILCD